MWLASVVKPRRLCMRWRCWDRRHSALSARLGAVRLMATLPRVGVPEQVVAHEDTSSHSVVARHENAVLRSLLNHDTLFVSRQVEWTNIISGYEVENRYTLMDGSGQPVAYIAEESGAIQRQLLATRRAMNVHVLSPSGEVLLKLDRPSFFISSKMHVYDAHDTCIGHVLQQWSLLARQYDIVMGADEVVGTVRAPPFSWEFQVYDSDDNLLGAVDKNFTNVVKETLTDANQYAIHFAPPTAAPSGALQHTGVDIRALVLALSVATDVDYFSRISKAGGMNPGLLRLPFLGLADSMRPTGAVSELPQEHIDFDGNEVHSHSDSHDHHDVHSHDHIDVDTHAHDHDIDIDYDHDDYDYDFDHHD